MRKDFALAGDYLVKLAFVFSLAYLFYAVFDVFFPVIIAVFLALVLRPLVDMLKKAKIFGRYIPESAAIALVLAFCFLLAVMAVIFLVRPLVREVNDLTLVLPDLVRSMQHLGVSWLEQLEHLDLPDGVRSVVEQALSATSNYALTFLQKMLSTTVTFASNTLGIIVLPFLVYYFLQDGHRFSQSALKLLPPLWRGKARAILEESAFIISAYVQGVVAVGFIGGCIVWLGTYFIGLDYPYVFALMAVFAEAIPFVGAILSVIPAFFIAFLKGPDTFVLVVIFYSVYQVFTGYILGPRVQGKYLKMHPAVIIISILVGGKIAGMEGMIFAVPAVALLRILLKNIVTYPGEE